MSKIRSIRIRLLLLALALCLAFALLPAVALALHEDASGPYFRYDDDAGGNPKLAGYSALFSGSSGSLDGTAMFYKGSLTVPPPRSLSFYGGFSLETVFVDGIVTVEGTPGIVGGRLAVQRIVTLGDAKIIVQAGGELDLAPAGSQVALVGDHLTYLTPVYLLDSGSMEFQSVEASGEPPAGIEGFAEDLAGTGTALDIKTRFPTFPIPGLSVKATLRGRAVMEQSHILSENDALVIEAGSTLSVGDGITLALSGDGAIYNYGMITGPGSLTTSGNAIIYNYGTITGIDTTGLNIIQPPSPTSGGGAPGYPSSTLTDSAAGVTVSGLIQAGARLTVTDATLHAAHNCDACDAIRAREQNGKAIFLKDISLIGSFNPPLTITLDVGSQYNGQTVTVVHCKGGVEESFAAKVVDGKITFTVNSLSPFAVFAGDAGIGIPKTGDKSNALPFALFALVALCGMGAVVYKRKRKSA